MPSSSKSPVTLTVAEHLEELRRRLGVSLIALLVAVSFSFSRVEPIIRWLQRPAGDLLPRFVFFTPTEPLMAYLKVSVLAGLILAMPVMLWQLWAFVRAGLNPAERAYGVAFVFWGSVLFVLGVSVAYYCLLPVSLKVLLGIGRGYLEPMISIDRYLSFVTALGFWCGLLFELPIVLWLLSVAGIVTPEWLRQQRSYALLVLVIIAAIVTPTTDPVSLLIMAVPMVALYEVSILIVRYAMPPRQRAQKKRVDALSEASSAR